MAYLEELAVLGHYGATDHHGGRGKSEEEGEKDSEEEGWEGGDWGEKGSEEAEASGG